MKEETSMDEDALVDGWDAFVDGRANGLDHLSTEDREVIEMLHSRTWSPAPRPAFTAGLRARVAGTTRSASGAASLDAHRRSVTRPPQAARPPQPRPRVRRLAPPSLLQPIAAALVVVALLIGLSTRLPRDRESPTVQAPVAAFTTATHATPTGAVDPCLRPEIGRGRVGEAFVDPMMTEIMAAMTSVRYATLQTLTRGQVGSVIPDGYDLSGVSGIVVDAVVVGAAEATFREGAWTTTIESMRFTGTSPVTPTMPLDLLRGDVVVYPVGALVEMENTLAGRPLEVVRLVLHDIEELPGRVTDSITLETVGHASIDIDQLLSSPVGFSVTFGYLASLASPDVPGAACPPLNGTLISGIIQEPPIAGDPDARPTYGGPFVWLAPFVLAPPATPST